MRVEGELPAAGPHLAQRSPRIRRGLGAMEEDRARADERERRGELQASGEDDREGVFSGAVTHRELREISTRGPPPDEDRVDLSAELVHMLTRREASDPL